MSDKNLHATLRFDTRGDDDKIDTAVSEYVAAGWRPYAVASDPTTFKLRVFLYHEAI